MESTLRLRNLDGKDPRTPIPLLPSTPESDEEDAAEPTPEQKTPEPLTVEGTARASGQKPTARGRRNKKKNQKASPIATATQLTPPQLFVPILPPRDPTGGVEGHQAAMGRGGRPDAEQAAMGRGGNASKNGMSSLAQRAAAILGAPSTTTTADYGTPGPNNTTTPAPEPVNMAQSWTAEEIQAMDPLL